KLQNKVLYKEYLKINGKKNYLKKIIIGPKVKDAKVFREYIKTEINSRTVEVTVSDAPLD
ncbi:MAG: hypothetical protein IKP67_03000, partial [Spirochaetales bacterium]|nr:hypothetical protein [Spirochaetales bacterium]